MKPTVSDRMTWARDGSVSSRMVGSRVANTWSRASTPAPGQAVEQGRLAGVGVADQGHDRIGHAPARLAMQAAGAPDAGQLLLDPHDPLGDPAPVELELALARAAQEAEAAALALEMGPGAHQPRALVGERGQLDLEHALAGVGALAEDLQDQAGTVDDLGLPEPLEVALLHRRQGGVDHHELGGVDLQRLAELLGLARAEQRGRHLLAQRHGFGTGDLEVDRARETDRLGEPGRGRASTDAAGLVRGEHPSAAAAAAAARSVSEGVDVADQPCGCCCSSAAGSYRRTAAEGITVDTACL